MPKTSEKATNIQPQELTSLITKPIIQAVGARFDAKTKQAKEEGIELSKSYMPLTILEFKNILIEADIPRDVVEKIAQHIDVNDDGDIEFDEFINFVLAAESNLEYSKKIGMDKFTFMNAAKTTGGRSHSTMDILAYTHKPSPMIITGGSSGTLNLYNPMNMKLLDSIIYESKNEALKDRLTNSADKVDKARLHALFQKGITSEGNVATPLTSCTVCPYTPHILCTGATDCSISVFDLSSQNSRLQGTLGRITSLHSIPSAMCVVADKKKDLGAGGGNGSPTKSAKSPLKNRSTLSSSMNGTSIDSMSQVLDAGGSVVSKSTVATGGMQQGSVDGGHSMHEKAGSSKDVPIDNSKNHPVQTLYIGTLEGELLWLPLDPNFGHSSVFKQNAKYFHDSMVRASGRHVHHQKSVLHGLNTHQQINKLGSILRETEEQERLDRKQQSIRNRTRRVMKQAMGKQRGVFGGNTTIDGDDSENQNTDQLKLLMCCKVHDDEITKVIYLEDMNTVVTSSRDGHLTFFSHKKKTPTKRILGYPKGHHIDCGVGSVSYSPKNKIIVTACGRLVCIWDVFREEIAHQISDVVSRLIDVEVDDRNDLIIGLLENNMVHVWGSLNYELRQTIDGRGIVHDSAYISKGSELIKKMILFENKELGTKLKSKDDDALLSVHGAEEGVDKKKEHKIQHPVSLCLAGQILNSWVLSQGGGNEAEDEAGDTKSSSQSTNAAYFENQDIVACLYNMVFNLVMTVYSLGTVKVYSAVSGATLRAFTVGDDGDLQIDESTGLPKQIVSGACFDCTQRRLVLLFHDNSVKIWNFFAGQEIDVIEPVMPTAVSSEPDQTTIAIPNDNDDDEFSQGRESDIVAPKEQSKHVALYEVSGVEQRGREKFVRRTMFIGSSGGTLSGYHDMGETIEADPLIQFRWKRKEANFLEFLAIQKRKMLLQAQPQTALKASVAADDVASSSDESDAGDNKQNNMSASHASSSDGQADTQVLWTVYLDYRGNDPPKEGVTKGTVSGHKHGRPRNITSNGLSAGSGNGEGNGLVKGSFMAVGYSNGSSIVFDGNQGTIMSHINPAPCSTILPGMKLKKDKEPEDDAEFNEFDDFCKSDADAEAAKTEEENQANAPKEATSRGGDPTKSKGDTVQVDCAVGLYDANFTILIGACSDRYIKFWDCETGGVLCSVSYIHEYEVILSEKDKNALKLNAGSKTFKPKGIVRKKDIKNRDDEERISDLKIKWNENTKTYILVGSYDSGYVRIWELQSKSLTHLMDLLADINEADEKASEEMNRMATRPPEATKPTKKNASRKLSTLLRETEFASWDELNHDENKGKLAFAVSPVELITEFLAHNTGVLCTQVLFLESAKVAAEEQNKLLNEVNIDIDMSDQPAADTALNSNNAAQSKKKAVFFDDDSAVAAPGSPARNKSDDQEAPSILRKDVKTSVPAVKSLSVKPPSGPKSAATWRDLFSKKNKKKVEAKIDHFNQDHYLITCSVLGDAMMWTLKGVFIGHYGGKSEAASWNLLKRESWPNRWLIQTAEDAVEESTEGGKKLQKGVDSKKLDMSNVKRSMNLYSPRGEKRKPIPPKNMDRPTLSIHSTLEAEVAKAFNISHIRTGRRLTSATLANEVKRMGLLSYKNDTENIISNLQSKLQKQHPLVEHSDIKFNSDNVARVDI